MLVALLMALLLSGGGGIGGGILSPATVKEIGKRIQAAVADHERAEVAGATVAELKAEIKGFEKRFATSGKVLTQLYKDHDADGEAMMAVLEELNDDWESVQKRAIDLRFEAKMSLTREEWDAVFSDASVSQLPRSTMTSMVIQ